MRVNQNHFSRRRSRDFQRETWGRLFGSLLCEVREQAGHSIEVVARAAGMEAAEWEAVEAGQIPRNWVVAFRMADALRVDHDWMVSLVLLCRQAWE
jgi:transcriptional regulator with XRE-family HTH domain